jgi:hypothetical protein
MLLFGRFIRNEEFQDDQLARWDRQRLRYVCHGVTRGQECPMNLSGYPHAAATRHFGSKPDEHPSKHSAMTGLACVRIVVRNRVLVRVWQQLQLPQRDAH